MLFSQDKNKGNEPEKKRSIFGLLFNPRLDRDITPMKESASMFVRMLASLFVTTKLFPKDHPAFKDDKVRLTMREVIGTAYNNLSFTKEGVPQILYFGAVVGMLGFGVLFLITLLLSFMAGTAHAQDSVFVSSAGDKDWAIAIIDYLFMGTSAPDIGSVGAFPNGDSTIQLALGQALSYYSSAVLVLAGLLLLYHLTFMVAETAHTGEAMGKQANKIWAPIRLVFAIGLLVPIASSADGVAGYNTGQYLGMQVARWGSGLASNIWSKFADALEGSEFGCTTADSNSPSCLRLKSDAPGLVKDMLLIEACSALVTHHLNTMKYADDYQMNNLMTLPTPNADGDHYLGLSVSDTVPDGSLLFVSTNMAKLCGGYYVPEANDNYNTVYTAQLTAFTALREAIHNYVEDTIDDSKIHGGAVRDTPNQDVRILNIITDYQDMLNDRMVDALSIDDDLLRDANNNPLSSSIYKETGWLTAGAWFNHIITANAERTNAFYTSAPLTMPPEIYVERNSEIVTSNGAGWATIRSHNLQLKGFLEAAQKDLTLFSQKIDHDISTIYTTQASVDTLESKGIKITLDADQIAAGAKATTPFEWVLRIIDDLGGYLGVWNSDSNALAVEFGLDRNPLAEISAFGQKNMMMATDMYTFGGVALLLGTAIAGISFAALASGLSTMFFSLGSIFLIIGFAMAYIIPLYPFFRFFFASITWFMSIFEMIVAMPLFALAHVNPNGAGLSGDKAKYGYSVMMQILLRPTLMVFGLVAGFLLFTVSIHFLNYVIVLASSSTGAYEGALHTLAKMVYSVLYCLIVVVFANQCFSTIGLFPQTALTWLGMQAVTEEKLNDAGQKVAAVATYGTSQMGGQIQGIASAPGAGVKGYKDKKETLDAKALAKQDRKDSAIAAEKEQKWRDDMLNKP